MEKANLKEDHSQSYTVTALALLLSMTISMPVYISGLTGSSSVTGSLLTIFAEPVIFLSMLVSFLIIIFDNDKKCQSRRASTKPLFDHSISGYY